MHMKNVLVVSLLLTATAFAQTNEPAPTQERDNWPTLDKYWFKSDNAGTPSAEVKLGFEYSDFDDGINDSAAAIISRVRLNYQSAVWKGFDAFVQAQYVGPLTDKHAPASAGYDTINDPEIFRFQQLYVGWAGYDTKARIGAQEILLDNQRFIGNVGWRFNAQSFNAGMVQNESVDNLKLFYSYIDSINQSNGDNNDNRQYHLLNAAYKLGDNHNMAAFGYFQRNDFTPNIETYGLRYWGRNSTFVVPNAVVAFQREAYYGSLAGKFDFDAVDVEIGTEYISGGTTPDKQFQTLNGTAHAFNGWADQFLGTGGGLPGGLIDFWVKGSVAPADKVNLSLVYHYFNTAFEDTVASFDGCYGNEFDGIVTYKINPHIKTEAAFAYYMRGNDDVTNFTRDETVLWVRGTFSF